jgi:peptidoglycan hydrolase CwlO-like protein
MSSIIKHITGWESSETQLKQELKNKDSVIARLTAEIGQLRALIAKKDAEIAKKDAEIAEYEEAIPTPEEEMWAAHPLMC